MSLKAFAKNAQKPIPAAILLAALLATLMLVLPESKRRPSCIVRAIHANDDRIFKQLIPDENLRSVLHKAFRVTVTVPTPAEAEASSPWVTVNLNVQASAISGIETHTVVVPRAACSPL